MTKHPTVIDTNVWVALALENDSLHMKANEALEPIRKEPKILLECMLAELGAVLMGFVGCHTAHQWMNQLLASPDVQRQEDSPFFEAGMELFGKQPNAKNGCSIVDCIQITAAHAMETELLTFDKRMQKLSNKQR